MNSFYRYSNTNSKFFKIIATVKTIDLIAFGFKIGIKQIKRHFRFIWQMQSGIKQIVCRCQYKRIQDWITKKRKIFQMCITIIYKKGNRTGDRYSAFFLGREIAIDGID